MFRSHDPKIDEEALSQSMSVVASVGSVAQQSDLLGKNLKELTAQNYYKGRLSVLPKGFIVAENEEQPMHPRL